jgi:hypothetical protein
MAQGSHAHISVRAFDAQENQAHRIMLGSKSRKRTSLQYSMHRFISAIGSKSACASLHVHSILENPRSSAMRLGSCASLGLIAHAAHALDARDHIK